MKFTKTFKFVASLLLCAFVAFTAYAQFSPSIGAPTVLADGFYIYKKESTAQGVPSAIAAATRVAVTNFSFAVPGPRVVGGIGFYSLVTGISNTAFVLRFNHSPDNVTWTVGDPLTVTLSVKTNTGVAGTSNSQPQLVFGSLDSTNLIGVKYLKLTSISNTWADTTAITVSNVTATWFK